MKDSQVDHVEVVLYDKAFYFGLVLAKDLDYFELIEGDGVEERGRADLVHVVDVYTTVDQEVDHFYLAVSAGGVEEGLAFVDLIGEVGMFL